MFRPAFPLTARAPSALVCLLVALLAGAANTNAHADAPPSPTQLSGHLHQDDDIAWFDLTLSAADTFQLWTESYASGGFAPVLSLFSSSGELLLIDVGSTHSCGSAGAGSPSASSGFCWDARISASLGAGSYQLALSQDGNTPLGSSVAEGFQQSGRPDYTGQDWLGVPGQQFIQVDGQQRSSAWSLSLQGVTAVPEPAPWLLALAGLLLMQRRLRTTRRPNAATTPIETRV